MKRQQSFFIPDDKVVDPRKILSERVDFQFGIEAIRKKWKIEVHYFISEDQKNILKKKEFNSDISKLQRELKVDEKFTPFLTEYIFLDMATFEYIEGHTISLYEGTPPKKEIVSYYLEITKETTKKDLLSVWNEIETFIHGDKKLKEGDKEWKTFKRDRSIYRLAKTGYSATEIQKYIKEVYKQVMETGSIQKAESRYRKAMKIEGSNNISLEENRSRNGLTLRKGDSVLSSCFIEED